jgi:hypothetical protein
MLKNKSILVERPMVYCEGLSLVTDRRAEWSTDSLCEPSSIRLGDRSFVLANILEVIRPVRMNSVALFTVPPSPPLFPTWEWRSPGLFAEVCVIPEGIGSNPLRGNQCKGIVIFCDYSIFSEDFFQSYSHRTDTVDARTRPKQPTSERLGSPYGKRYCPVCSNNARTAFLGVRIVELPGEGMRHNLMMTALFTRFPERRKNPILQERHKNPDKRLGSSLSWKRNIEWEGGNKNYA